jgi:hypothetical protein
MPVMTDRRTVAANSVVDNILAGKLFEFAQRPSVIGLYATAAAVGLNASFLIGNEVLLDDQEMSSANRFPLVPDDFLAKGGALQGDRVVIRLRNTTGAGIVVISRVEMEPVG